MKSMNARFPSQFTILNTPYVLINEFYAAFHPFHHLSSLNSR